MSSCEQPGWLRRRKLATAIEPDRLAPMAGCIAMVEADQLAPRKNPRLSGTGSDSYRVSSREQPDWLDICNLADMRMPRKASGSPVPQVIPMSVQL